MTTGKTGFGFNLSEIPEIDLFILRRIRNFSGGEHKSFFRGPGFDFIGLREQQPGDKLSAIDWPHSSINNYDPVLVREFEEDKNATILFVGDASLSAYCGINDGDLATQTRLRTGPSRRVHGSPSRRCSPGDIVLRTIATMGLSGVFFQDTTGLFMFDHKYRYDCIKPNAGRGQVLTYLRKYQDPKFPFSARNLPDLAQKIISQTTRTSVIPFISDFLFDDPKEIIDAVVSIKTRHDSFIVIIDSSFTFDLPEVSAGWIEFIDVESGRKELFSKGEVKKLSQRIIDHQNQVIQAARDKGIEFVLVGKDKNELYSKITDFFITRRISRKVLN